MRGACCTTIWLLAVAATLAQGPKPPGPPDGKKGPPPGKGPPSYLGQMDANRDGFLELDELSERARPIIEQVVRGTGGDPRQPVPVGVVEEAVAASINRRPINADPKTRQLADELLQQFDTDGDGRIIKDEWKKLEETTGWKGGGGHRKADFDFDEEVTPAELALWITLQDPVNRGGDSKGPKPPPPPPGGPNSAPPPAPKPPGTEHAKTTAASVTLLAPLRSYRVLTAAERLPQGLPEWFAAKDRNQDGQVMMAEFSSDWTNELVSEFQKHDLNSDGIITATECLRGLGLPTASPPRVTGPVAIARPPLPGLPPRPTMSEHFNASVLVKRYDANVDGVLDKEEWKAMEHTEGLKGGGGHKKADQDRDDRINVAELQSWLASRPG